MSQDWPATEDLDISEIREQSELRVGDVLDIEDLHDKGLHHAWLITQMEPLLGRPRGSDKMEAVPWPGYPHMCILLRGRPKEVV
jgi:hypothetical protein